MARRGLPHRHAARRLPLLAVAAALGALGVGLVSPGDADSPAADPTSTAASASVADLDVAAAVSVDDAAEPGMAQAASAIPQAQARMHTIQAVADQRAATARAAEAAAAQAAAEAAAAAAQAAADAAESEEATAATEQSSADAPTTERSSTATPAELRSYAADLVGATQFACLDKLWTRESGWRSTAQNPSSTAYGVAQLLDSTWAYTGIDKTSDGYAQVDAGLVYIEKVYDTPCAAWAHSTATGWY